VHARGEFDRVRCPSLNRERYEEGFVRPVSAPRVAALPVWLNAIVGMGPTPMVRWLLPKHQRLHREIPELIAVINRRLRDVEAELFEARFERAVSQAVHARVPR